MVWSNFIDHKKNKKLIASLLNGKDIAINKANNECNIAHVYCETCDGTVYEVKRIERIAGWTPVDAGSVEVAKGLIDSLCVSMDASIDEQEQLQAFCSINLDANGEVIPPCDEMSSVIATEITFLHFDSVKALKELLESNRYDFLEALIDKSNFVFTDQASKIIRNIKPNEDNVSRLYKSLKTIESRAEWFDVSRLFGYSDVDGDPSTLVTAMLKESLKDKKSKIPEELVSLINNIFKGFTSTSETLSDDEQTKVQILKLIGFFVELADLLQKEKIFFTKKTEEGV